MRRLIVADDRVKLDRVIAHEVTADGWRGLTKDGDVYEFAGPLPPGDFAAYHEDGQLLNCHFVKSVAADIAIHVRHFDAAARLFRENSFDEALAEVDAAIAIAPTARARFTRGLILLSLGRWLDGWPGHEARLELGMPSDVAGIMNIGVKWWRDEDIRGKRLLLVHDAGYGDTLQCLRHVPPLRAMGVDIALMVPAELRTLARQVAPIWDGKPVDYFLPILSLPFALGITPDDIPGNPHYLSVDPRWRWCLHDGKRKVGIAWSVGVTIEGDYPRAVPLADLVDAIGNDADIYSVQRQGSEEATALGVKAFEFDDFSDCAVLMSQMDEIITVDTAAAHLAGAIGHPNVTVLLPWWHSWRWVDQLYPDFRLLRQTSAGDWQSVLSQIIHTGHMPQEYRPRRSRKLRPVGLPLRHG
jgi:hypothetical protein